MSNSQCLGHSFNQSKCICKAQACKNSQKGLYILYRCNSHYHSTFEQGGENPKQVVEYSGRMWKVYEGNKREMYTTYDYTLKLPYSTKALLIEANKGQLVLKV